MKQATLNWIDKAESDLLLVRQTLATSDPVFDGACFHAQQCAEKYLKAYMQEHLIRFPRIHDLDGLAALISDATPAIDAMQTDLQWLTTYAVDIRYPGASATQTEATRAVDIATAVREHIRAALGITEATES